MIAKFVPSAVVWGRNAAVLPVTPTARVPVAPVEVSAVCTVANTRASTSPVTGNRLTGDRPVVSDAAALAMA
jgi:hypothetical protein